MKIIICQPDESEARKIKTFTEKRMRLSGITAEIAVFFDCDSAVKCGETFDIAIIETGSFAPQGMALGRELLHNTPHLQVMFTSAGFGDLDAAFSAGAVRYFKRPLSEKRFAQGLSEALRRLQRENVWLDLRAASASVRLPVSDILYIEIQERRTAIATVHGVYRCSNTLSYWRERLQGENFAVPHKSYIVNLEGVAAYRRNRHVVMKDGAYIAIARGRAAEFHRLFTAYKEK